MGKDIVHNQLKAGLESEGWKVFDKGLPDVIAFRDNKVMFIEIKTFEHYRLGKYQLEVLKKLAEVGLDCYKWSTQKFTRITPDYEEPPIEKRLPAKPGYRIVKGKYYTEEEIIAMQSPEVQAWIKEKQAKGEVWY